MSSVLVLLVSCPNGSTMYCTVDPSMTVGDFTKLIQTDYTQTYGEYVESLPDPLILQQSMELKLKEPVTKMVDLPGRIELGRVFKDMDVVNIRTDGLKRKREGEAPKKRAPAVRKRRLTLAEETADSTVGTEENVPVIKKRAKKVAAKEPAVEKPKKKTAAAKKTKATEEEEEPVVEKAKKKTTAKKTKTKTTDEKEPVVKKKTTAAKKKTLAQEEEEGGQAKEPAVKKKTTTAAAKKTKTTDEESKTSAEEEEPVVKKKTTTKKTKTVVKKTLADEEPVTEEEGGKKRMLFTNKAAAEVKKPRKTTSRKAIVTQVVRKEPVEEFEDSDDAPLIRSVKPKKAAAKKSVEKLLSESEIDQTKAVVEPIQQPEVEPIDEMETETQLFLDEDDATQPDPTMFKKVLTQPDPTQPESFGTSIAEVTQEDSSSDSDSDDDDEKDYQNAALSQLSQTVDLNYKKDSSCYLPKESTDKTTTNQVVATPFMSSFGNNNL